VIGPILLVAAILATTPAVVEAQAKKVLPVDEAAHDPEFFAFRARLLVAVSHYSASLLRPKMARAHIDPARLVVAWNGCTTTPLPRVAARPGDPLRIMTLCRLEPRKNLLAAVQAVEQVVMTPRSQAMHAATHCFLSLGLYWL